MGGFLGEAFDYLEEFNTVSIIVRLVLATLLGGIIGIERENKSHSAGFRTFTLVCLGSALCTIVNIYLWQITGSTDVARLPAGVVNGIGFLGVGTIVITRRNSVKGLTTAAGLWATATLGISLGAGMVWVSVIAFAFVMLTISVMRKLSDRIETRARSFTVYMEFITEEDFENFLEFVKNKGFGIVTIERRKEKISKKCEMGVMIVLDIKKKQPHEPVLEEIKKIQGLHYLEEVRL